MARGQETRQRIVDIALQEVGVTGIARMTFGELAQAVGMSKSGLFAHFGSKEALELGIVEELCTRFGTLVGEPALAKDTPEEVLRTLFDRWLAWYDGELSPGGCPVTMAMSDALVPGSAARDYLMGRLAEVSVGLIEVSTAAGCKDVSQFLYEFTGVLMAYNVSARLAPDPASRQRAWAAFDHLMERHFGPSDEPAQR